MFSYQHESMSPFNIARSIYRSGSIMDLRWWQFTCSHQNHSDVFLQVCEHHLWGQNITCGGQNITCGGRSVPCQHSRGLWRAQSRSPWIGPSWGPASACSLRPLRTWRSNPSGPSWSCPSWALLQTSSCGHSRDNNTCWTFNNTAVAS